MKVNRVIFALIVGLFSLVAQGQMVDPVHFTSQLKEIGGGEAELLFQGRIDDGWHVYSSGLGDGGPISASFHAVKMEGVETVGSLRARGKEIQQFDKLFDMQVRYFEHAVTFVQKVKFTQSKYTIDCYLEFGACNDEMCMPPTAVELKKTGTVTLPQKTDEQDRGAKVADVPQAVHQPDTAAVAPPDSMVNGQSSKFNGLWQPVVSELQAYDDAPAETSLWYIFLAGLVGGFLALLTPCVWPVIPMTVSFFLKRNNNRAKAIREALTYGLSIIVIYVALGLLVTLLFGANALNALSTNAWLNIFFALLLVLFACSFFGAFELSLPSSWAGKVDQQVDKLESAKRSSFYGLLSIFLMAFTLVLVSFSCTGPIIGFLLVAVSAQGQISGPLLGMAGFSIGLAIPFAFFALFPSLLKSVPKSGGWMNTVKVVLGFIELAFALKFLSVADLAYGWRLLDREVFLSLWIVLFGLLGAYLMGWFHFSHDDDAGNGRRPVPVVCFFLALLSFAFTVYLVPGLWGAPLKAVSAFTPPMYTQDFNMQSTAVVEAQFRDYDEGMAYARQQRKPVIVDFTGFGCVNCRKMEAAVWNDPQVADLLTRHYVLISLYVDDKTPLAQPMEVTENGQHRTLRTVGDKWSYLQRMKFGANAQPFYVLVDNDGRPLWRSRAYDEDIAGYVEFLEKGLENYRFSE